MFSSRCTSGSRQPSAGDAAVPSLERKLSGGCDPCRMQRLTGTFLRTASHAPLCLTSTLLLRLITLSLKPYFDGHKHCSPLQPLRARHVLPVSFSSSLFVG